MVNIFSPKWSGVANEMLQSRQSFCVRCGSWKCIEKSTRACLGGWRGGRSRGAANGRIWFAQLCLSLAWPGSPRSEILNFCRSFDLERVGGRGSHVIAVIAVIAGIDGMAGYNIATDVSPHPPGHLRVRWDLMRWSQYICGPGKDPGPTPDYGDASSNAQTNCPAETCSGCFAVAESP